MCWRRGWQFTPVFLPGASPWTVVPVVTKRQMWLGKWAQHSVSYNCSLWFCSCRYMEPGTQGMSFLPPRTGLPCIASVLCQACVGGMLPSGSRLVSSQVSFIGVPAHVPGMGTWGMPGTVLGLYLHHFTRSSTPAYGRSRLTPCLETKTLRLAENEHEVDPEFLLRAWSPLSLPWALLRAVWALYLAVGARYNVTSLVPYSLIFPSSFLLH